MKVVSFIYKEMKNQLTVEYPLENELSNFDANINKSSKKKACHF